MKTLTPFHIAFAGLSVLIGLAVVNPPRFSGQHSGTSTFHHYQISSDSATQTKSQPLATADIAPESPQPAPTPAFCVQHGSAELIGEAGSMYEVRELLITELSEHELPPLDQGMMNVTDEAQAFRMLPDGMVFSKDISIVLPYDTALIPQGFTPDDILTYYYDKVQQRWIPIERDSVSVGNQTVHSKVNHFTDFINAIIKTPEMPETAAFTPTSIKELKAADPLDGLQLIQPPTANNSGTANLSYQLEIPAGRQGMQPDLALTYNSGGGNGWLGVGWDLSVPAITVETRWGVPRYDALKESEVYLYAGEQLVTKNAAGQHNPMPHRTNSWENRSTGDMRFYPRVEERFDSIVRHGTSPTNYWWSVTDRNGITNYYGKRHDSSSMNPNAVLRDASGNIAHWALTESVDAYGNSVRYYYSIVSNSGVSGGSMGKTIYPDSINYTGKDTVPGRYSIIFNRDNSLRNDVIVSNRYGFKEVTAATLCNVQVLFDGELVRTFFFAKEQNRNSNFKTRLKKLIRVDGEVKPGVNCGNLLQSFDANGKDDFVCYDFDYYDYPSADSLFTEEYVSSSLPRDNLGFGYGGIFATALGATKGKNWSVGGALTVGLGPAFPITSVSAGGNFDYGQSQSEGLLTMIDLNGDGLADRVFKKQGIVYYRLQEPQTSYGDIRFGRAYRLNGVNDFLKESSKTIDWGLQASLGFSASGSWPTTTSTTSTYFTDINGNGLPDLVTDRGPLFNRLDADGHPTFTHFNQIATTTPESNGEQAVVVTSDNPCDGGIIFDGGVSDSMNCIVEWRHIRFVKYQEDSLSEAKKGNRVTRLDKEGYDVDSAYWICTPVSPDPDMDAVRVWVAPYSGIVDIQSVIRLIIDSTESRLQSNYVDGIDYVVQKNSGNTLNSNHTILSQDSTLLFGGTILANDGLAHDDNVEATVVRGDILFFRLRSRENHSFDKVVWRQTITYRDTALGLDIYGKDARSYRSDSDFLLTDNNYFMAVQGGDLAIRGRLTARPLTNPAQVKIYRNRTAITTYNIPAGQAVSVNIDTLLTVQQNDSIRFIAEADSNTSWSCIRFHPTLTLYADFNSDNVQDSLVYHLPMHYDISNYQGTALDTFYHKAFGTLYRGWGQFAYNNDTIPSSFIHVSDMVLPTHLLASSQNDIDTSGFQLDSADMSTNMDREGFSAALDNIYNPLAPSTKWVEMTANTEFGAYVGFGNITYMNEEVMANTRCISYMPTEEGEEPVEIPDYDCPVPAHTAGASVKTFRKQNKSRLNNSSINAGYIVTIGASESEGTNTILTDYMDLNGDRYPDCVSQGLVQYTMPWGGIGSVHLISHDNISESNTNSSGQTFGASYSIPKRMTGNDPKSSKITFDGDGKSAQGGSNQGSGGQASLNGGVSHGGGTDETVCQYMDINGDGLPDMLYRNGKVRLNCGYNFLSPEYWTYTTIRQGESQNYGSNIGANFNTQQASIGGGMSVNYSENKTNATLTDINGDGLPDIVNIGSGNACVRYNLGNGLWSSQEVIPAVTGISKGSSFSASTNAAVTVGFTIMSLIKISVGIQTSPFNRTFSNDQFQLTDINGDGYVDIVTSSSEEELRVRYNRAGKTNLLKKATNFTNSYVELDYTLSPPCYEQPQRSWNLTMVATGDTFPSETATFTRTEIEYRNPHHDRYERIDFGYDTVITRQINTADNSIYRSTVQGFNNRNFNKRGWKKSESVCDGNGRKYIETLYEAQMMDMEIGTLVGDSACPSAIYVSMEAELTRYYEGLQSPQVVTAVRREYDNKRNVVRYTNFGDTARTDEYFVADISYKHGMPHNLISLPDSIIVKDKHGNVLQKRAADYDSLGKATAVRNYISDTEAAETSLSYDEYGNMQSALLPANDSGQRMRSDFAYDTVIHSYPVRIRNSFGYVSTAEHDYRFGKPVRTTDINGNEMRYHYDEWGRLDTLLAPNEIADNARFTIAMSYDIHQMTSHGHSGTRVSYATTKHYDRQHPNDPIETVVFVDGWGRAIQTKQDAEVDGVNTQTVSGRVQRDCFGRTVAQYHPFVDHVGPNYYDPFFDANTLTSTSYDILDRPLKTVLPTGDSTLNAYGFGTYVGKTYFRTTVTDPNGISVTTLTGTRKQQIRTIAPMGANTNFVYNPLGLLLSSTDPNNHTTSYTYDLLGRTLSRTHPDAGTDTYTYDAAGNLTLHATQVLNGAGETIKYHYTFSRLDSIIYPLPPSNNVRYTYGDSTATNNRKGKITLVEDASGFKAFSYGKMGEVTEEKHTFVLPNEQYQYTFKMNFSYDSWNRVQTITYPDNESVYYYYNCGGMLKRVQGRRSCVAQVKPPVILDPSVPGHKAGSGDCYYYYDYIDSIHYNAFGQKTVQWNGNGTSSFCTYDILQRLQTLQLFSGHGPVLQNITYTYDKAGNITRIGNAAAYNNAVGMGGRYLYAFSYDSLYRLETSSGSFSPWQTIANYSLSMSYHADGRIAGKSENGRTCRNSTSSAFSRSYKYIYNTTQPHTASSVGGMDFGWDANGNMVKQGTDWMLWDEENRLSRVELEARCAYYKYDNAGERFFKASGPKTTMTTNNGPDTIRTYNNPVLYASPYLVATPQGYTKHYFVETERIVSKIGDGKLSTISSHVVNATQLQRKQAEVNAAAPDSIVGNQFTDLRTLTDNQTNHPCLYWQHSDHLGSASWVTDTNGRAVQHLQYMPWGEDFVSQKLNTSSYSARYTFSGKEKDSETGLSYFGARYYSSDLSIWLSVDPLAGKYPGLSPYAYCAGNPVKLVDLWGEEIEYASFADRVTVFLARITNSTFREMYKELKTSGETYVFKKNDIGENKFSTDGNKLYINYCTNDFSRAEGQNIFSQMRHETTHAYQFEHGEIGFEKLPNGKWSGTNYDIWDEYEAQTNQNYGTTWNAATSRSIWNNSKEEERIQALRKVADYSKLPDVHCNNTNAERIKNANTYALPHRIRSSIGKSFTPTPFHYYPPIFNYRKLEILRNDTIWVYNLYVSNDTVIDSIVVDGYFTRFKRNTWMSFCPNGEYIIAAFTKIKSSMLLRKYNAEYFNAEHEVRHKRWYVYTAEGSCKRYIIRIGAILIAGEPKKTSSTLKNFNSLEKVEHDKKHHP